MKTCDTCVYWGQYMKECCDFVNTTTSSVPPDDVSVDARVLDDSGLTLYLKTGPKFGCVHHKEG